MEEKNQGAALLVFGLIAVIAVIGIAMLLVENFNSTGAVTNIAKIYGGAVRTDRDAFPYAQSGVDAEIFDEQGLRVALIPKQRTGFAGPDTVYAWSGEGKRSPDYMIASMLSGPGRNCVLVGVKELKLWVNKVKSVPRLDEFGNQVFDKFGNPVYEEQPEFKCYNTVEEKGGYTCCPTGLGGIRN